VQTKTSFFFLKKRYGKGVVSSSSANSLTLDLVG